jgi:hypothetical protein
VRKRQWFRVLVDANGKAVDCKPVSAEGDEKGGVFYFLATSAGAAARLATKSHEARLLAARRARHHAEGRCKCGRPRDRKNPAGGLFLVCSGCDERHQVHEERRKARKRGEEVPPLDRREVLQERKRSELDSSRLATLIEVQRTADRFRRDPRAFANWLIKEIEALTRGKERAA